MTVRYALVEGSEKRVHFADSDTALVSYCGQLVSVRERYSRRAVGALRGKPTCGNCAAVMAARKRRA